MPCLYGLNEGKCVLQPHIELQKARMGAWLFTFVLPQTLSLVKYIIPKTCSIASVISYRNFYNSDFGMLLGEDMLKTGDHMLSPKWEIFNTSLPTNIAKIPGTLSKSRTKECEIQMAGSSALQCELPNLTWLELSWAHHGCVYLHTTNTNSPKSILAWT